MPVSSCSMLSCCSMGFSGSVAQDQLYQCTPKMYSPRQFYLYSSSFTCASGHGHAMLANMSAEPFPSTEFEAPHTAPTRGVLSRRVRR